LRKIVAAILAVPVLVVLYLPVLRRRGTAIRVTVAAGAGLLILAAALGRCARRVGSSAGDGGPGRAGTFRPERRIAPDA